jgi:hypothetical protein
MQTLSVGSPAVKAHLDHGDLLGACSDVNSDSHPVKPDTHPAKHDTIPVNPDILPVDGGST